MLLDNHNNIKVYPEQVVLSYIQQYITDDYEYKSNDKGHWINIPSPFYNDKRKRLGFNIDTGIIFDFKLQKGWDFESFVIKHHIEVLKSDDVKNKKDVNEFLFKFRMKLKNSGIDIKPPNRKTFEEEGAVKLPELTELPVGLESFQKDKIMRNSMGRKAVIYLQKREFTSSMIKGFNLQYIDQEFCPTCHGAKFFVENGEQKKCPECKGWGKYKFHGRIFVPTYEEGKLVYFQARDYLDRDKKWKYLNPKVPRKQVVYFYDRLPEKERVFVAEGPFDAMYLHKYPVTALMGNKMSRAFAQKLLWKSPTEVIFIPDFDDDVETRKRIFSNLTWNIKKIKEEAPYNIKVGVYNWFALTNAKDLNAGGIDYVDDNLIIYPSKDRIKFKEMIHDALGR